MVRKALILLAWYFVLGWCFMLTVGARLLGNPLHDGDSEKWAQVIFSPWQVVGRQDATGSAIYERKGTLPMGFHNYDFVERKVGTDGRPERIRSDVKLRPLRGGAAMAIPCIVVSIATW